MQLIANDLSVHEQFHDISSFRNALERIMTMRNTARQFGRDVQCSRMLLVGNVMTGVSMQQALGQLGVNERRAAISWMTRTGPFWDDCRQHERGDYLECRGEVVTDSSVGEAAYRKLNGFDCALVSFVPSDWDLSHVEVIWRRTDEGAEDSGTTLENFRDGFNLRDKLSNDPLPVKSWYELARSSRDRFTSLTFSSDCFDSLEGIPFSKGASERLTLLLDILDRLARAFDADGTRTAEGHSIYRDYFTGANALFSDSSDTEKNRFRDRLTFRHPTESGEYLFCPWHGKVQQMTLRLHFSWPIHHGRPAYVVYAGYKLTKQ